MLRLLFSSRLGPHFWAQFLGAFNDNVFRNAVIILITYRSLSYWGLGTEQLVAFAGAVGFIPFFFLVAFAGEIADKLPKHKLVLLIKLGELAVMCLGVAALLMDSMPLILLTALLMGAQSTLFGPVKYSILAELVSEEQLVDSNALIGMGTFLAILTGTLIGGLLAALQWQGMVGACGLLLLMALLGIACAWRIPALKARAPELKVHLGLVRPLRDMLEVTVRNRKVLYAVLSVAGFWFIGATMLALFPILVKETLGMGETVVTLFLALFSVGVALGAGVSGRIGHSQLKSWVIPLSLLLLALTSLDLYFATSSFTATSTRGLYGWLQNPGQWRIMADLVLLSMSGGLFIVPLQTFIQNHTPTAVRSRVVAGSAFFNTLFMILSAAMLVGLYGVGVAPQEIFLVVAGLSLLGSLGLFGLRTEFI